MISSASVELRIEEKLLTKVPIGQGRVKIRDSNKMRNDGENSVIEVLYA